MSNDPDASDGDRLLDATPSPRDGEGTTGEGDASNDGSMGEGDAETPPNDGGEVEGTQPDARDGSLAMDTSRLGDGGDTGRDGMRDGGERTDGRTADGETSPSPDARGGTMPNDGGGSTSPDARSDAMPNDGGGSTSPDTRSDAMPNDGGGSTSPDARSDTMPNDGGGSTSPDARRDAAPIDGRTLPFPDVVADARRDGTSGDVIADARRDGVAQDGVGDDALARAETGVRDGSTSDGGRDARLDGASRDATGTRPDARKPRWRRPALIYVDDSDRLAYLDTRRIKHTVGVTGDIRAIGPSLHYDTDGIREIPYAIADGSGGPALKVVNLEGDVQMLDPNVMGYTNYGRLGVADVDNDIAYDVVYPDDDKSLVSIDRNSSSSTIVKNGTNGNDAKPAAFMGTIDADGNGKQELYWIGTSSNVKYVTESNLKTIRFPGGGFHVGSNNNVGVGAPRDLDNDGDTHWAMIDGSNNPGLVPAGGGSFQSLNTQGRAVKTPIAFGDVVGGPREEVLFVDTNGTIRYVSTKNPGQSSPAKLLRIRGRTIQADPDVGLVSGYTALGERL